MWVLHCVLKQWFSLKIGLYSGYFLIFSRHTTLLVGTLLAGFPSLIASNRQYLVNDAVIFWQGMHITHLMDIINN